jgi:hypothetical protein
MFACGVFSFHPARCLASREFSLNSIIPTLARLSRNFNHSRTYALPGGGGCTKLVQIRFSALDNLDSLRHIGSGRV